LRAKLLEECDVPATAPGRPSKILRLASESVQVLGVVVGAVRSWVLAAGLDGQLHEDTMREFPTPGTYQGLVDGICERAEGLRRKDRKTLGMGVSIPGLLNRREQRTLVSPNVHQTDGHTLGIDLAERLKMETMLFQESYALCLAERAYGNAKGLSDFAMIDVAEGLGLGVFSNGHYISGHSGLGGELGHITVNPQGKLCGCGNRGCLETEATDRSLAAAISKTVGEQLGIEEVVRRVQAGELQPTAEFHAILEYLSIGMAAVVNLFNPTHVFVHGRFLDASDWLFSQLVELTRRRALGPAMAECQIIRARGSKRQGAVAGIIHHLTSARGPALLG
jgi:predicted NBD/HSP70 family sugar kinase